MKIRVRTEYHSITLIQRTFTARDALLYTISVDLHCTKCYTSQIQYRLSDNTVEMHSYQQRADTPALSVMGKKTKKKHVLLIYCSLCLKELVCVATALFETRQQSTVTVNTSSLLHIQYLYIYIYSVCKVLLAFAPRQRWKAHGRGNTVRKRVTKCFL